MLSCCCISSAWLKRHSRNALSYRLTRKLNKWLAYLFVLLGGLLAGVGGVFVAMYVWGAIITRLGEADQSLVFWYLPILFLGLILGAGGLKLLLRGIGRIRSMRNETR